MIILSSSDDHQTQRSSYFSKYIINPLKNIRIRTKKFFANQHYKRMFIICTVLLLIIASIVALIIAYKFDALPGGGAVLVAGIFTLICISIILTMFLWYLYAPDKLLT